MRELANSDRIHHRIQVGNVTNMLPQEFEDHLVLSPLPVL